MSDTPDLPDFEFSDELNSEYDEHMKAAGANMGAGAGMGMGMGANMGAGMPGFGVPGGMFGGANAGANVGASAGAANGAGAPYMPSNITPEMQAALPREAKFFAWQICYANMTNNELVDADNFPLFIANRETIIQMLGIGMSSGQNAFPINDQMFVLAISEQVDGQIRLVGQDNPFYNALASVISSQLLQGMDKGMLALMPTGQIVPIKPSVS